MSTSSRSTSDARVGGEQVGRSTSGCRLRPTRGPRSRRAPAGSADAERRGHRPARSSSRATSRCRRCRSPAAPPAEASLMAGFQRSPHPGVERKQVVDGSRGGPGHADRPSCTADDRRARHVVVVAGHAPAVGAGRGARPAGHRADVGGQPVVADHDVAALAVLAHHPGQHRRARPSDAVGQRARCTSASYSAVRMLSLIPPSTDT